jgi:2-keto-4-pentenoate hydratase/2-oxohepta-3-ene-1,7-dioic acid hydratase in catechol pathway
MKKIDWEAGGVGQGTQTFLKVGDVMMTEIEGLGRMQNRFVAENPPATKI